MQLSQHKRPGPEAFRGFIEGVRDLQDYLRTNAGERLADAEQQFNEALAAEPNFAPAQYYMAIVLTHSRKAEGAITLLEGLKQEDIPFKAEVLYNLAFAYAKTYKYENVMRGFALLDEAKELASRQQREDLMLLVESMKAWINAVYGGLDLRHTEDFVERQLRHLPETVDLTKTVLADPRLQSLPAETSNAIRVEAHNAAGIAFMYMGQHSIRFDEGTDFYWKLADDHYGAALRLHSRDVRVLDNLATLNLLRASRAARLGHEDQMSSFSKKANDLTLRALSYNSEDKFRYLNLARSYALLGNTKEALRATEQIRLKPGVIKEKDVQELEEIILQGEVAEILEKYPVEEKLPENV